jgi:hypothetical protein
MQYDLYILGYFDGGLGYFDGGHPKLFCPAPPLVKVKLLSLIL